MASWLRDQNIIDCSGDSKSPSKHFLPTPPTVPIVFQSIGIFNCRFLRKYELGKRGKAKQLGRMLLEFKIIIKNHARKFNREEKIFLGKITKRQNYRD